ncbi:MAG TPA: HD domain-containing protein [Thermoplasmatales archaeon]|nr:HD domain-containing protein [Thermoplasmatales archaeon]
MDERQTRLSDLKKRRKERFVSELEIGDTVNDLFVVKKKMNPRYYRDGLWFELLVGDRTGEIKVNFWGDENTEDVKDLFNSFRVGDVVLIKSGKVELYDNEIQISVDGERGTIERCSPDEYYIEDFIPALDRDKRKELINQLREEIGKIKNIPLKTLLTRFFDDMDFVERFSSIPSSVNHHHNYIGGNLEHTLNVVKICKAISDITPDINRDLLITGAILHDIGKTEEYRCTSFIDKTDEGRLAGHIVLGDRMVKSKIEELRREGVDFPRYLENQVSHMILSHHGKLEWGSPEIPKLIEAIVLHHADLMDSQIKYHIQKREEERRIRDDNWGVIWDNDMRRKKPFYIGEV